MSELRAEIVIIGGGTGGVAAALAACRLGRTVIITEPTDWLGGQLTAQAVPPDEHPWVETEGITSSYREFRRRVRDYYRRNYPLTTVAQAHPELNPGGGYVSRLCHEPRVGVAVIDELLAPHRASGRLRVLLRSEPVSVDVDGDRVSTVTVRGESDERLVLIGDIVIDATELGDLLDLAKVEHVIGAESQHDTGELHAVDGPAQPLDQQALSWCFALDVAPGDNIVERPAAYSFWRDHVSDFWPASQLSWEEVSPKSLRPRTRSLFHDSVPDLWNFRRILNSSLLTDGSFSDISLVNWPQIDYWLGPVVGVDAATAAKHLQASRDLSLSFLHWMQTEAPRHDGGLGYPELRLRADVVGTSDGLAKQVYVREARRIQAEFTVLEEHVGVDQRGAVTGAEHFADSVGVGCYRIDLHPSTGGRSFIDISSYPFQIPLGALLPIRVDNVLPAAKNIGSTHITNGCYRLHPVEWNIGEVSGALAAFSLDRQTLPRHVRNDERMLAEFQQLLATDFGVPLEWPRAIRDTAV